MTAKQLTLFNQVSEIQISYRNAIKSAYRPKITCSDDAYLVFQANWNPDTMDMREEFKVLALNRANQVLGIIPVSVGGVAGTVVDPKIIFGAALKTLASSIVLGHNHPSSNLTPSEADIRLTRKLKEAGAALDLPVIDHLILSSEGYKLCGISAVSIIFNELLLMPHDTK
jgi:DNA repair protein RadC